MQDAEPQQNPEQLSTLGPTRGSPSTVATFKHPLQDSWTLWHHASKRDHHPWGDKLKRLHTFDTVEDFWCLWNNIKTVNQLPEGGSYYLFKKGIAPKWEDAENQAGGKWLVNIQSTVRKTHLPSYWLFTVLALIGSDFDDADQITGAVVCLRKKIDRIAVWTSDANAKEKCLSIGTKLKELLGISLKIGYQPHADAKKQIQHTKGLRENKPQKQPSIEPKQKEKKINVN